jgi:hypothetical protein
MDDVPRKKRGVHADEWMEDELVLRLAAPSTRCSSESTKMW